MSLRAQKWAVSCMYALRVQKQSPHRTATPVHRQACDATGRTGRDQRRALSSTGVAIFMADALPIRRVPQTSRSTLVLVLTHLLHTVVTLLCRSRYTLGRRLAQAKGLLPSMGFPSMGRSVRFKAVARWALPGDSFPPTSFPVGQNSPLMSRRVMLPRNFPQRTAQHISPLSKAICLNLNCRLIGPTRSILRGPGATRAAGGSMIPPSHGLGKVPRPRRHQPLHCRFPNGTVADEFHQPGFHCRFICNGQFHQPFHCR